jgi:SAM-dependent methyltransferase
MPEGPQTWHYGLVAKWWAEFNEGGLEIDYFRTFIERDGQPALDVACGTGRLLLPYVRAGLDVDGCDVSADMIALCREQAEREGLSPTLFVQAMHELDPPRTYRTVFVCGGFGLGSTREQDLEALVRMHECLEPGGMLVLDNEVPYANPRQWSHWPKGELRGELPRPWGEPGEPRGGSDGNDYALNSRLLSLDPLEQQAVLEMRAYMWRDGELLAEEEHRITINLYFRNELLLMLERAGFVDVVVHGDHKEQEATPDHDFLVFVAKKPGLQQRLGR